LRWVERHVLRAAAALQVMTDKDAADHLQQGAGPTRLHPLPNGVVVPASPLGAARPAAGAALRTSLGIAAVAPVVLFLGRLHAIKGLDVLLEGFARAAAEAESEAEPEAESEAEPETESETEPATESASAIASASKAESM